MGANFCFVFCLLAWSVGAVGVMVVCTVACAVLLQRCQGQLRRGGALKDERRADEEGSILGAISLLCI